MDVYGAVSNPTRRGILDLLKVHEQPAGALVAAFPGLPQPAISRHLRILRQSGLVTVEPRSRQRIYALQPAKLRELDAWVSRYREFWTGRLDALVSHLEGGKGDPRQRSGDDR